MDKNSAFGELMEKGQQATVANTQKVASDIAGSVAGQLGFKNEKGANDTQNSQQQVQQAPASVPQEGTGQPTEALEDNELTKEMVEDFYSPSTNIPQNTSSDQQEEMITQQKLAELRRQLHQEVYYDPLVNPKKQEEEERSAERVERQEKEEMQDLEQKEADKPPPIAVQRAQTSTEMNRGVAG